VFRLETNVLIDGNRMVLPPRNLSEAVREAQIYALTGVPPHAQRGMTLAQALRYAQQHSLNAHPRARCGAASCVPSGRSVPRSKDQAEFKCNQQ
jgi:hypothetical protein